MSANQRVLCVCYALIAVAAMYGTWSQNLYYFSEPSISNSIVAFGTFVGDTRANPATRSITIDIMAFLLAAIIWMVYEARRIGVRFVWVYIVLSFMTAISVTFPLFLIAREMKLANPPPGTGSGRPATGDYLGLLAMSAFTLWVCWFVGSA